MATLFRANKKKPCPRCKASIDTRHCGSPYCRWYACYHCQRSNMVIFDGKERHFVLESQ